VRRFALLALLPNRSRLKVSALDNPDFGVELNRDMPFHRPYSH
jgi:L-rhamnonate dehydratase